LTDSNYQKLGASATKSGLHATLNKHGLKPQENLFAQISEDTAGNPDYASFIHADGAGTKSIVAYLYARETGDISFFARLAEDALAMNLDDIYCIGSPDSLLLSNAIGRNAKLISDEMIGQIIGRYKTLAEDLNLQKIPLTISGGETADCGDVVRTLIVDATVAGRIKKENLIYTNKIAPGDVIVGLSSTGKSTYEKITNSGISSNGLTLARHSLISSEYREKYPEICDPYLEESISYRGGLKIDSVIDKLGTTIGDALSSPTRTYAPILKKIYENFFPEIHGVIHNTGGGQTKVIRFGTGNKYIKDSLFPCPPIFELIQERGNISWKEMYQVFNMGHRIEIYTSEKIAVKLIELVSQFEIEAKIIGRVEKNNTSENQVAIQSSFGEFLYSQLS
jgi:phosphoribosylformylglycinamidine cyclo-ligase